MKSNQKRLSPRLRRTPSSYDGFFSVGNHKLFTMNPTRDRVRLTTISGARGCVGIVVLTSSLRALPPETQLGLGGKLNMTLRNINHETFGNVMCLSGNL